jgi:hypothetical protein
MKSGDSEDISASNKLHFVQGVELLNAGAQGLHKRLTTVEVFWVNVVPKLCILVYSTAKVGP